MKLVCISDTHSKHSKLEIPSCDILIHAGDWTGLGSYREITDFAKWLNQQEASHIVLVPGNHETIFEENLPHSLNWITDQCLAANVLINQSIEIEGIKIFGSPTTPTFFNWGFMKDRGEQIARVWDNIPNDTNILVTHGPAYSIMDRCPDGKLAGCEELYKRVFELPKLTHHVFGHIHVDEYNPVSYKEISGINFHNVSICTNQYIASNPITVIDYEVK